MRMRSCARSRVCARACVCVCGSQRSNFRLVFQHVIYKTLQYESNTSAQMKVHIRQPRLSIQAVKYANRVEIGYIFLKGTEYFVSLYTSVFITEVYNVMVNSEEIIGTTECLTL
jgi:hypothetical protein